MLGSTRLAGMALPEIAALLGLTVGVPAIASRVAGQHQGYANPQYGGVVGTAGAAGLGNIAGGLPGGILSGIAYNQGHQAGRQRATNYMLGPGYDARQINWQQLPGTGNVQLF